MTPFALAHLLLEDTYSFANTSVSPPSEVADFIIEWGQLNIPEDVLAGDGREREPHVTVKYGLKTRDVPDALREIAKATKPFSVFMGVVSLFTNSPEHDVVKIDVESPQLRLLNKRVSDNVPHEDTYPTYHPHLTLAYVQKGSCDHLNGDDPFKAKDIPREFTAYGMVYSAPGDDDDADRTKETLLFSKTARPDPALEPAAVADTQWQDIAARAFSLVESWRNQDLSADQMKQRLRTGNWGHGMKYWVNRQHFPQAFKRFVEQATNCIEGPDPFVGLDFPIDPDQIKQFLRNNGKRREGRTIL